MKRKSTPKQTTGDPKDPQGMTALAEQFFEWMQVKNYAEWTVITRRAQLARFIEWAAARGVTQPGEVTRPIVERYQRFLYHYRSPNGNPLCFQTQNNGVVAVRAWFKWLAQQPCPLQPDRRHRTQQDGIPPAQVRADGERSRAGHQPDQRKHEDGRP